MLSSNSSLDRVFAPKSVVVVGASGDPRRIGGRPLRYLKKHGYQGQVFGVNPRYEEVQGYPCFPDIASLPDGIDLAVLMLSSANALDAVRACAKKGIAGIVITAAGFAESGEAGHALQNELAALAAELGIRVIGPNTIGFRNHNTGVYATFGTDIDSGVRPGNVAVVAQSGGLGGYLGAAQLRDLGIGTRWMIDTGNEVDIDCAECVDYLARENGISVIGLIIEGCRDSSRLLGSIAAARQRGVPVVVLKIGRSEAGAKSVALHTGALSGEDRVWDTALSAAGAIRARDESHFIDLVRILDMPRTVSGSGLGVVTLSGGVATVLLDAAERRGIDVPAIGAPPAKLREMLPLVNFANPLDASGQMANTPDALEKLVEFMLEQDGTDTIVVWLAYALLSNVLGPVMARGVVNAAGRSTKPVIVVGMATTELREMLAEAGVALAPYPTGVVDAIADIAASKPPPYREFPPFERITASSSGKVHTGPAAERILAPLPFVPHRVIASRDEAAEAASAFGCNVVVKGEAEGLAHKTELGLVKVAIATPAEAAGAFDELQTRLNEAAPNGAVIVQPMVTGIELYAGVMRDPVFGPVVSFGLGGIFVEIFKDAALLLAPCSETEVVAALRGLKGWPMLAGARGKAPIDVDAFAGLVTRLSEMIANNSDIVAVDMNPIIASSDGVVAVDAVVLTNGKPE